MIAKLIKLILMIFLLSMAFATFVNMITIKDNTSIEPASDIYDITLEGY